MALLFQWAIDQGADNAVGMVERQQLEREGWARVGSHPVYQATHLMVKNESQPAREEDE